MSAADDEIDNLFRNHFAGELDPIRGQAARAFDREVIGPMRRRLQTTVLAGVRQRARQAVPLVLTMAACCAMGFYVPHWMSDIAPAARPAVALIPATDAGPRSRQATIGPARYTEPVAANRANLFAVSDLPLHLGTGPQTVADVRVDLPTVWRDDQAATVLRFNDSWHTIVLTARGNEFWAWVADAAGEPVFNGPIDTAEAMAAVPEECRRKVEAGRRSLEQYRALRAAGASSR